MRWLSIILTLLLLAGCRKKAQNQSAANNPVPSIPVSMTLYPNDPLYAKLRGIGGWMYIQGGINGIVIYRKSEEEFVAIERSSTQLPNNPKAAVIVMNDNFTLRDTISDSRWRLIDGTVTKGPATWPLRLYGTTYDGNSLRISN